MTKKRGTHNLSTDAGITDDAQSGAQSGLEAGAAAAADVGASPEASGGASTPEDFAQPPSGSLGDAFEPRSDLGIDSLPTIGPRGADFDLSGFDAVADGAVEQFLGDDGDYARLPHPDVFNAYPPEVQRKIMEWTDRDVKARRDDESRRQDEMMRAQVDRERRKQMFPAIITVIALICGAVTGIVTANPLFTVAFMLVPLAVIAVRIIGDDGDKPARRNKPPRV